MHLEFLGLFEFEHKGKKIDCLTYQVYGKRQRLIFAYMNVAVNIYFNFMHVEDVVTKLCSYIDEYGFEGYVRLKERLKRYIWIYHKHVVIEDKIFEIKDVKKEVAGEDEVFIYPTLEMENGQIEGEIFNKDNKTGVFMHRLSGYSKLKEDILMNTTINIKYGTYPKVTKLGQELTNEFKEIRKWFHDKELEIFIEWISNYS